MMALYRAVTFLASPFIPLLLRYRQSRGKEDGARKGERLGKASIARPPGMLIWMHAASIGEVNSLLPLAEALLAATPQLHILITSVTVTSAALIKTRLPERALHQFAPVDTPQAVKAFLAHWHPQIALWVDSELWPNLLCQTRKSGAIMGLLNARMSERSFRRWQHVSSFMQELLSGFTLCFPQTEQDAERLRILGMKTITAIGNLKYDASPLPASEEKCEQLRAQLGWRPVWLATSTHAGEEEIIAQAHQALKKNLPTLLTILVPRHATRAENIRAMLAARGIKVAQRSKGQELTQDTDIYLADTMGELGLFYRLSPIAFIGGTLVAHGGQNPLEAARLGCVPVMGPDVRNFTGIVRALEEDNAVLRIHDEAQLEKVLYMLLTSPDRLQRLAEAARQHVQSHAGIICMVMKQLQPLFASATP